MLDEREVAYDIRDDLLNARLLFSSRVIHFFYYIFYILGFASYFELLKKFPQDSKKLSNQKLFFVKLTNSSLKNYIFPNKILILENYFLKMLFFHICLKKNPIKLNPKFKR